MKNDWKKFIDKLDIPSTFLHRDEFIQKLESHPHKLDKVKFPAIFLKKDEKISLLASCDEINKLKTLDELVDLIAEKLSTR